MADIIDYALLNAHKDFDTLPYSKIDSLVFSELAYLSFDSIVPNSKSRSKGLLFSDIAESESYEALFPLERTEERNKKLLNAVAYSKRYGKVRVNYYEDIFDIEKDTQFCAITFILPNGDACIAFRGTDSTITGWKENFNMLFTSPVAAQSHSVIYVNTVAKKIKGNIILTGHSKGGNLAIYSGSMCSPIVKNKIVEIQAFDSPGFTKEFIESKEHTETEKIIRKFMPEESLVGVLLNNREQYRIIKSEGSGIMQHDPFLWQIDIESNDFIDGEKLYMSSKFFDATFNDWVNSSTPEQREQFVEALFQIINAFNSENALSFVDLTDNIKSNSSVAYETLKGLDPEMRSLVMQGIGDLFSSINKNVKSTPKKLWNDTLKKFKEKAKQEE
ncbi:MAG: DUF2974 domain-containing protein [Clostridia bacterium]|nr:DUF2974 domain-containing protein [Clostridia bacterium]